MKQLSQNLQQVRQEYTRPVGIITAIYILGISAIIRANFYYIDDMGRAMWGYQGFHYFGRYISQYMSVLLHADAHLTDISPFPQVLAAVLMALSAVIVLKVLTGKKCFSWLEYVAVVPLGLSPYFLECFSYKFDAPYMAISVLASVMPVLLEKRGWFLYGLGAAVGALAVCMSYQAASGIFPMLVAMIVLKRWNGKEGTNKELFRFAGISAAGYLVGMVLFAGVIMPPVSSDVYTSGSLPQVSELPFTIYHNLKQFYGTVLSDFKLEWIVLTAMLCVAFLWAMTSKSERKWYVALLVNLMGLIALMSMAFGLYLVLKAPIYAPRAMYGFGALLCFMSVMVVSHLEGKRSLLGKAACLALCWCFFIFAFTYGNALYVQKTYTDYRISSVIDDLDELGLLDRNENRLVQINGTIGKAPPLEAMRQDYQMLNRLVPIVFSDSSWEWGRFGFDNYYGLNNLEWDDSVDLKEYDLPVVMESFYHTIRSDGEHILIELNY